MAEVGVSLNSGYCRAVYSRFHGQTVETELRCGQLVFSGTVPPQAAATDAGLPCQARGTVLDGALSAVPVKGPPLRPPEAGYSGRRGRGTLILDGAG